MSAWAGLWNNVSVPAGKMEVPPSWHIWLWTLLACVRRVRSIAEACGVSFLVQKMFCLSGDKKTTEKNPDFGCQSSLLSHAFYAGTREGVLAIPLLRCSLRQGRGKSPYMPWAISGRGFPLPTHSAVRFRVFWGSEPVCTVQDRSVCDTQQARWVGREAKQ